MATFILSAQLTDGTTLSLNPTDRIWLNGGLFGDNINVGAYQDSTHLSDAADIHRCSTVHVRNTKYLTGTTVSLDGASSSALPIPASRCALKFNFSDAASVATSNAKFYAYDGVTDVQPVSGVLFQAAEGAVGVNWITANGSASALALADQAAATSHDFYVALSMSPAATGVKTGKIKLTLTYI